MRLIDDIFNATMGTAWKPVRSFYDGLSGKTSANGFGVFRDGTGEAMMLSPRQKLTRRLKQRTKQTFTGKEYDINGNVISDHATLGNVIGGAAHLVGDATLGTFGTALGWGTRATGLGAYAIGKPIAKGAASMTADVAWQGAKHTTQAGIGAAKTAYHMSRSTPGQYALFLGAGGAMTAGSLGSSVMKDKASEQLGVYIGQQADALPSTMASYGALGNNAPTLDNMGADGELVFALHNLR